MFLQPLDQIQPAASRKKKNNLKQEGRVAMDQFKVSWYIMETVDGSNLFKPFCKSPCDHFCQIIDG